MLTARIRELPAAGSASKPCEEFSRVIDIPPLEHPAVLEMHDGDAYDRDICSRRRDSHQLPGMSRGDRVPRAQPVPVAECLVARSDVAAKKPLYISATELLSGKSYVMVWSLIRSSYRSRYESTSPEFHASTARVSAASFCSKLKLCLPSATSARGFSHADLGWLSPTAVLEASC